MTLQEQLTEALDELQATTDELDALDADGTEGVWLEQAEFEHRAAFLKVRRLRRAVKRAEIYG